MSKEKPALAARATSLIFIVVALLLLALFTGIGRAETHLLSFTPEETEWIKQHKALKIGITPDWPPFEFIDQQGNYEGLSADLLREVIAVLGIELKVVSATDPWNEVLGKLRRGELDGVASIFISDFRREYVNFSDPYVEVPHVVIVRDRDESFSSMEEINGRSLSYMQGWVCQDLVERDFPQIKLVLNPTIEGMIGQVLLGTTDAGLIDLASLGYYSSKHNLSGLKVAVKSPYSPRLAFGFPKNDKIAAALFDKVMASIPAEKIAQIRDKWMRGPDGNEIRIRQILRWVAALAIVVVLIFFWNVQLRRKVADRTSALEKEVEHNRQQAEALKESESKIRAFFDQTMQFIGLLSVEGVLLEANHSSLQLIKTLPEKVIGRFFWETPWWSHQNDLQIKLKKAVENAANGNVVRFEATNKDFNGKLHYVDFSIKPYRNQLGEIVFLIAEGRDISQQHEFLMSLKESEERFRLLFESSPDPCWILQDGKFIECNVAAGILFGFSSKDGFLGLHPSSLSPEFQSDGLRSFDSAEEKMKQAVREGFARFDWEHKRPDGTVFPVEITLSPLSLNGRAALYCIGRDLTEKYKADQEKKKLEEQFMQAQKMESIGRLAGGVAHDFNNLLTAIRGFTELILFEPDLPVRTREMLQEIDKAGASATALTRQLLAFSRKQIFEPRTINLNDLILHIQKLLVRLIGEDVKLKLSLSDSLGSCFADPGQIEQVLVNLVVNARDAMPGGGTLLLETGNVVFDAALAEQYAPLAQGNYLMLAVSDTGTGMSENVKKHMFEPFFTTKEHGKGTGLGLATVYGVVRQSGGNVVVYSEPGHGTTFKIYLPQVAGGAETLVVEKEEKIAGNNQLVMVVEDEELLRQLVNCGLPSFNYRIISFADGNSALEYLQQQDSEIPDIMVTDVIMPGMNGRELADRVKNLFPSLPVLFISGYTHDAIGTQGILEEDIKFLAKPFSVSTLAAKIGAILAG